jgi:GNAT superfamily N-acetyltransferase
MKLGPVSLSPMDRERFGVVAARCSAASRQELGQVLDFCRAHGVELLVLRCEAADYATVHAIESSGGRLMDTLVYYERCTSKDTPAQEPGAIVIRSMVPGDAEHVRNVAAAAFEGYVGHYHADPRLDRAKADETYADWAYRSCLYREAAQHVLVAEEAGAIVGFLTLRLNHPDESEIVLNGVLPAAQRHGVYRRLLGAAIVWSRAEGAQRIIVSTQLTNTRAQKAWTRMGFEPSHAFYTFHLWFS